MKLKTLKDIRRLIPIIAPIGRNLKKEDYPYEECGQVISIRELRQEAINWIKVKFLGEIRDWSGEFKVDSYVWGAYSEFCKFFNITPQELE